MHVYIDFVSISRVTSSCSVSLNVGIVICIVSSVSGRPVNKIAKKKKSKSTGKFIFLLRGNHVFITGEGGFLSLCFLNSGWIQ